MEQNKESRNWKNYPCTLKETNIRKQSTFLSGVVVGLAGALFILGSVYLGTTIHHALQEKKDDVGQQEVLNQEDSAVNSAVINKLQLLEETINQYFYLGEVTPEQLDEGIYKGMLSALEDPYSEYYTEEELVQLMNQTQGIYYGIGAYVSIDTVTSLPKISGVIEGTPAEEAMLRANDIIYEVDGTPTYGLSLTEVVAMIKGEEGTQVNLTIIREGESDDLIIPVIRRKVESPTVELQMLDNNMAYIQILEFDEVTIEQFKQALTEAESSGMKGLILDLRANPGGSLASVIEIAKMILPEGMIVYTEDKYGKRNEYMCDGANELEVPLVVLIDVNSASAAEILAGAIKDYELGTLVGTTTFGKGIVQQIIPFEDGSAVKLTISSYFTPKGNNIHGVGVSPDILCEFDGEAYYGSEDHPDNQLEKAKETLAELMQKEAE